MLGKQPQREAGVFPEEECLHRVLRSFAVSYVMKFSFSTPSRDHNEDIISLEFWIRFVFLSMVTPTRNGSKANSGRPGIILAYNY